MNTAINRKIYEQYYGVLKRTITERKNETWEKKCEEVDRYMGGTRVAEAWKTIKNVRKDTRENAKLNLIKLQEWVIKLS